MKDYMNPLAWRASDACTNTGVDGMCLCMLGIKGILLMPLLPFICIGFIVGCLEEVFRNEV